MKAERHLAVVILLTAGAMLACARLTPSTAAPQLATTTRAAASAASCCSRCRAGETSRGLKKRVPMPTNAVPSRPRLSP